MLEQVKEEFQELYVKREKELQKLKKTKNFYPLPGTTARYRRLQNRYMLNTAMDSQSFENIISGCLYDVLCRITWLLLIFGCHNVLFRIFDLLSLNFYCVYTMNFNNFLQKMLLKLVSFSALHIVRKCLGLTFDIRDIIGYVVVYAALALIFLYDSETWVQFIYNMVILGSLFTN